MPRADGQTMLHIHRREFYQVAHACGPGRFCGQLVQNGNLRPGVDEEQLVDSFKGQAQACGFSKIANQDVDTMTKERLRLLGVAHENTRPVAALEQMVDDLRPYISRRSCDEVCHKAP